VLLVTQKLILAVEDGGNLVVLGVIHAEDELLLPCRVETRKLGRFIDVVLILEHNLARRLFNAVKLQVKLLNVAAVDFNLQFVRARTELFEFVCVVFEGKRERPMVSLYFQQRAPITVARHRQR